jgi:uncharacterized repeat protein (TIGR04138 family)
MSIFIQKLAEVVRKDPRYAYEAYEFVFQSLHYAQRKLGREPPATGATEDTVGKHHVSGRELLEAARELALLEFGMMARYVLKVWGINRTEDFGNIVFNLIENELMSKTNEDSLDDFRDVFNLDEALEYQVSLDEAR